MVKRTIVVHCFDGAMYYSENGGTMVAATAEKIREVLGL